VCSPTTKGSSRIEESYETSDMRKPFVQCPHCNHSQLLLWKNVTWDKDEDGGPILDSTAYACDGCGVLWSEYDRMQALKKVDWLQTKDFTCVHCEHHNNPSLWSANEDRDLWTDIGIAQCEECKIGKCSNMHAGFWANKMYSSFRPLSNMVKLWTEAQGNLEKLKVFINTQLAETFDTPGESIESIQFLTDRKENYNAQLPDKVGLLTAGIDTQNNRLEVEIVGWGLDEESWSIDYKVIAGDPKDPDTWRQLDSYLQQKFYYNDESYTHIAAACIDMGGGHTQYVTNYCRHRIGRRIWPIRGVGGDGQTRPVWPNNPGRGGKQNVPFYNVGVDAGKNTVFGRLLIKKEGAGYCHFPHDREDDWFKQLIAERRETKWKGAKKIMVWANPKRARNEAFDNRVYAYAALCGLQSKGWVLNKLVETKRLRILSDRKKSTLNEQGPLHSPQKSVKSKKRKIVKSNFMGN